MESRGDLPKMESRDVLYELESELKEAEREGYWKCVSIYKYKVSDWDIEDQYRRVSVPQVASLGPYHYGNQELRTKMEKHKFRALNHFCKRSGILPVYYLDALDQVLPQLMDAYESLDASWYRNNFLKVILIDGCFMLEIFCANAAIRMAGDSYGLYGKMDPIFSYHGKVNVMPYIRRDMLMLENQIPMLALQTLVQVKGEVNPVCYLNEMILKFLRPGSCYPRSFDSLHILDIYRSALIGYNAPQGIITTQPRFGGRTVRSAEELHNAGVKFKSIQIINPKYIYFSEQGTLGLPCIDVDGITESALYNVMAFERAHVGLGSSNAVTSFVAFLGKIIKPPKDVRLLQESSVISSTGFSEQAVADMFSRISKDAAFAPEGIFSKILDNIDDYCQTGWQNQLRCHMITLKDTYFRSPWTALSLMAAISLLFLTLIQTIYTVLSY